MKRRMLSLMGAAAILLSVLPGCGGGGGETASSQAQPAQNGEDGPLAAYEEPLKVSQMLEVDAGTVYADGESLDDNIITRFYKEKLNIEYDFAWQVDSANYAEQLDLAIASNNDLPDQFIANKAQIYNLSQAGQIADMTQYYEEYASDNLKEVLSFNDNEGFESATVDGKLYGLPLTNDVGDGASLIFVRKDWMDRLNLEEPKTLDDLIAMAQAFVDNDMSGSGNTIGLGLASDLGFTFDVFANAYGAYPDLWIDDGSGSLVYGSTQPAVKEGLLKLQEVYSKGLIHQEFAAQDVTRIAQMVAQGRLGIMIGPFWYNDLYLTSNMKADTEAEWVAYSALPAKEGELVATRAWNTTYRWLVVNANYSNPEAAVKQMNLWYEMWQGEYADWFWENKLSDTYYEIDLKEYCPVFFDPPLKNIQLGASLREALESKDPSGLNPEGMYNYEAMVTPKADSDPAVNKSRTLTWEGSFKILNDQYENFVYDQYRGPHTTLYSSRKSLLKDLETDAFVRIIMGEDISTFDSFVEQWKSAGGTDVTNEVNQWYQSQQ